MVKKEKIQPKIIGAFVLAVRLGQEDNHDSFLIKLSAINSIAPWKPEGNTDEAIFYTYKDCCYYVPIHPLKLMKAVNSFIFEPDTHWERYGFNPN